MTCDTYGGSQFGVTVMSEQFQQRLERQPQLAGVARRAGSSYCQALTRAQA